MRMVKFVQSVILGRKKIPSSVEWSTFCLNKFIDCTSTVLTKYSYRISLRPNK